MAKTRVYLNDNIITTTAVKTGERYGETVIGRYKSSIIGNTWNVTFDDFVGWVSSCFQDAAKIETAHDAFIYAGAEAELFRKLLYGTYSYCIKLDYKNLCNNLYKAWNDGKFSIVIQTGKKIPPRYTFKSSVPAKDRSLFAWAISHPIEFVGGMKELEAFGGTSGTGTGGSTGGSTSTSQTAGIDMYLKYILIGLAVILLIKYLK